MHSTYRTLIQLLTAQFNFGYTWPHGVLFLPGQLQKLAIYFAVSINVGIAWNKGRMQSVVATSPRSYPQDICSGRTAKSLSHVVAIQYLIPYSVDWLRSDGYKLVIGPMHLLDLTKLEVAEVRSTHHGVILIDRPRHVYGGSPMLVDVISSSTLLLPY